jgi:hypothetical protein
MQVWINEGKKREESTKPTPPKLELFFIAGNNSGTGIQKNIIDNDGCGLIIEPEADVLASAIQAEYGQWSHLLRKAHDHEFLSYNRRKDHEYRECDLIRLSVVICGTPNQLVRLIPGAENGLFSRQQSLAIGEKFGFTAKQVEYFTCKMMDKGVLERTGRGEYSFIGDKRNVLGEENQKSSRK